MCRGCCGGPLVGGTGFVTTAKYDGATGNVIWWIDSGQTTNAGAYHNGYYYEWSGVGAGTNFIRQLDLNTGEELQRRNFSPAVQVIRVYINGGNMYTIGGGVVVDKINPSDLSSYWRAQVSSSSLGRRILVQDDIVVIPETATSNWKAYEDGTTHLWDLAISGNIEAWHFIDGSGQFVGSRNNLLKRYDGTPSLVDSYDVGTGRVIQNAVLDGSSNIWITSFSSGTTAHAYLVDDSLSDVFSPAAVTNNGGGLLVPVSGAAYWFGIRYVNRITSGGTVTQRLDNGSNAFGQWLLDGDQDTFEVLDTNASSRRMRSYDDSSAPASLDWTITPTLVPSTTSTVYGEPVNGHHVSRDSSGNIYVTGTRLADATLSKVAT